MFPSDLWDTWNSIKPIFQECNLKKITTNDLSVEEMVEKMRESFKFQHKFCVEFQVQSGSTLYFV